MRVLHLVGSPVSEFFSDLSLVYARGCLAATADPSLYDTVLALVLPDGSWRFPADLTPPAIMAAGPISLDQALARLVDLRVDVAVPQMFCLPGMTTYRSLLDLIGVPYVGNPPAAMALTAHKARARAVVAAAGVDVPRGELLRPGQQPTLPPPVVVKPVDTDNSVATSLVLETAGYPIALAEAFAVSVEVLVEAYVPLGREVRCGVLERDGVLVCLPLEEYAVDTTTRPIRGYADKLRPAAGGGLDLVAKQSEQAWIVDVTDPATEPVWALARACHVALGCRDYSLVDVRIDPDGTPWFLEAGLYCSFAPASVIPTMAAAAGIGLPSLFAEMVDRATSRPAPPRGLPPVDGR